MQRLADLFIHQLPRHSYFLHLFGIIHYLRDVGLLHIHEWFTRDYQLSKMLFIFGNKLSELFISLLMVLSFLEYALRHIIVPLN